MINRAGQAIMLLAAFSTSALADAAPQAEPERGTGLAVWIALAAAIGMAGLVVALASKKKK